MEKDLLEMSQRERDVLKVMAAVLKGQRTQVEAARLLKRSVRQVRRIELRLRDEGDGGVIHKLRGRPSNRRLDPATRAEALRLYRDRYGDFGPTLAAEKLAGEHKLDVAKETLRQWLLGEGLWQRQRRRDKHRSRRTRRACLGEMVQADASEHDWLEGRGPRMALVGMIDDATGKVVARFHASETTEAYMDVLWRWLKKFGRPVAWYGDRHGIFRAEDETGRSVPTQFSRALSELDVELILANSPQAKGRVERLWGTAQDRLVKELRLAGAATMGQANKVLERQFVPWFNRRCVVKAASPNDAHRPVGPKLDPAAILSHQEQRTVANDYTIRLENRVYQLLPPAWPGERGGRVIVEKRLDGSMRVRFKGRYLEYREIGPSGPAAPGGGRMSLAPAPTPAELKAKDPASMEAGSAAARRAAGRSGRTPALPCPPVGKSCGSGKQAWRPAPHHPWRGQKRTVLSG